ncbi:MAG: GNAT family N-acetyltransferase [bacterium]|nr:GNAT family N-acetyltransferase [bacterium]
MDIIFTEATEEDIAELIRLRIAYMIDDFGSVSDYEKECMEKQLSDYFKRKLGDELVAFAAKDGDRMVSVAYLHIIEMPANSSLLNGIYGVVLSVYTEPEYRGKGLCTQLMNNLLEYGKKRGLGRVDLSATKEGHPIYEKVGFVDKDHHYTEMRYKY